MKKNFIQVVLFSKVIFFAGGGTNSANPYYSSYTLGKISLIKAVELLANEINFVNKILHEFLHCEEVRVRVATIHGLMCPKFHADHVYCRMLVTVRGPSTEWIACDDVQQDILSDFDSNILPLKEGKTIRKLAPGDMSLLKGGKWQDGFSGVIHRSPHEEGPRLLLTFDPILPG